MLGLAELELVDGLNHVGIGCGPGGLCVGTRLGGHQRIGQLAVDVTANLRLVFDPADEPVPTKEDGGLDWDRVKAVRIREVVDYHG